MAGALIAPVADALVASALGLGARLVAEATAPGLAFALDELGDIDIPDPVAARIDKAQLRALATLYLAADLEPAGIIPAVETLAGLAATGALQVDLGAAEGLVAAWWRARNDRISEAERNAFFSRLFGTSSSPVAADADRNFQFEDRMLELCEALYKLDELGSGDPYGGLAQQARVRAGARALIANLGEASSGSTAFVANEVVTTLKDAFAIVGHSSLRGAFAARDLWGVVGGIARIAHKSFSPAAPYIRRGKAGMIVVSWLAEISDQIGGRGPLVEIGHPVVGSAIDWIEATLDIGEAQSKGPAAEPARPPAPAASPWSALGA
ncbi:hypothetical protein [Sphingosinicella sp. BN140058]|uniref:hypothetical protein n=1 Tax=Sphingosinicella sp. BN140058 TaxID=1892855 RepID=UPI001012A5E2|nr:hypothetical protein [Sphingosinicella sp. BN140058]QAY75979.1 hypothetical protein ETR14_05135 [Sphingosinicella sp. BN140058]